MVFINLSFRKFPVALDLGCGRGHIAKNVLLDMVGLLYQSDMAEDVLVSSTVGSCYQCFARETKGMQKHKTERLSCL